MLNHVPRMTPSLFLASMAFPVLVMLLPAGVSAQGAVGQLNAVAGPPLPKETPIAVVAEEFTDINTRLQGVVEKALVARGYTVQANAPVTLSYDTEMSGQTDPEPPGFQEDGVEEVAQGMEQTPGWDDGGGELGRDEPDIFGPDSESESIPLGSSPPLEQGQYSLSFTLGRDDSPASWQGSISANIPGSDPFEAAEVMVPILADHIGQTVRGKQVPIE